MRCCHLKNGDLFRGLKKPMKCPIKAEFAEVPLRGECL